MLIHEKYLEEPLLSDVKNSAREVYGMLRQDWRIPLRERLGVYKRYYCELATPIFNACMKSRGYQAERIRSSTHTFTSISLDYDRVVVDLMWQQRLPHRIRRRGLPKVLVGTQDQVQAFLEEIDVPEEVRDTWRFTA